MNIYSILSFIAFLLYLQAGVIILNRATHRPVNIVFSLLCLAFSIFAFFSTLIYSAPSLEHVYLYDRLASIGWTAFPVLMVLFFIKLSNNKSIIIKNIIRFVFIPIVIISLVVIFFDLEQSKLYYYYNDTWFFELNRNSVWVHLFVIYLMFSVALSFVILFNWYLSTNLNRQRKQAVIIIISLLVFFAASTFTNIILPFLNIAMVPALAPINSILWIAGVFYALIRYQKDVLAIDVISNLILNHINQIILFLDNNKRIFSANKFTLDNLNYSFNKITKLSIYDILQEEELLDNYFQRLKKASSLSQTSAELISSGGEKLPVMLSALALRDKYKNQYGYVFIGIDNRQNMLLKKEVVQRIRADKELVKIKNDLEDSVRKNTQELFDSNKKLQIEVLERNRVEAQIKHVLNEKITLLQEVHHRVKNNMQIIISLIKMLSYHKDIRGQDSDKILQIAERVGIISSIHEVFYASKNISKIDFAAYLRRMKEELNSTLAYNFKNNISYKLNLSQHYLEIDKAIPCGIIFHELLSNAIKYAFPKIKESNSKENKEQSNIVRVDFFKHENEYTLSVSDNGIGLQDEFNLIKKNSVGLQMVDVLAKDHLNGKVKINNASGTAVIIKFA